jgi:AcrR family transcriptional regulator
MGRPRADDPKVKANIMRAAEGLFASQGFAGVGIREITASAGVNGAMIHYYFGNKEGLYRAILKNAAGEIRALLLESTAGLDSVEERLRGFVKAYATYVFSHQNLARILLREMISGGKYLKEIAEQHYIPNYALAREAMREGLRRKQLRQIDTDLAPVSLIGMVLIFQVAQPLISVILGKEKYDNEFIERLSGHTVDLFLNGARSVKRKSKNKKPAATKKRAGR